MFGMSMTELIIIGVLALVLIGPEGLPDAARTIGKTLKEIRKAGDDLRDTFDKEIMQEVKDVTKDFKKGFDAPQGVIAKGRELLLEAKANVEKEMKAPVVTPPTDSRPLVDGSAPGVGPALPPPDGRNPPPAKAKETA